MTSTKKPEPVSINESEPTKPPFKIFCHVHKPCERCFAKNADLDFKYNLQCRECGHRWQPVKSQFTGNTILAEAIEHVALVIAKLGHPEASDDLLQWYGAARIGRLKELTWYHVEKTEAQNYVCRFNILTRLIETQNTYKKWLKTANTKTK